MPFEPVFFDSALVKKIDDFLDRIDITDWYKKYSWKRDTWENGFPDILKLETVIGEAAKKNSIQKSHLIQIAQWGRLKDPNRVDFNGSLKIPFYDTDKICEWVKKCPEMYLGYLDNSITGYGPTYSTKLLRFALPSEFGAIDTRLVRVFGKGDSRNKKADFLKLSVSKPNGGSINRDKETWPSEYRVWTNILRYIAQKMNDNQSRCPHPSAFVEAGLRENGTWHCADVEMALFSYASHFTKE